MTENYKKEESLGESFERFLQEDNYQKINSILKQSLESVLDLTKKGIDGLYKKWGPDQKALKPAENPALVRQKVLKSDDWKDASGVGKFAGVVGVIGLFLQLFNTTFPLPLAIILTVGGFELAAWGSKKQQRITRLQKYLRELGSGTVATIRDLSLVAGVTESQVRKDLEYFIREDVLKEARMVEGNSIFILDRGTYDIYKKQYLEGGRKQALAEDSSEKEINEMLKKLNLYSEGLTGEAAKRIRRISETASAILDYEIKHPESSEDLRKFHRYYLPTTLELVRRYRQFELSVTPESEKARKEILETLETVEEGFTNLLDNLNADLVMDTRSDMSVLETIMKQEGLVDRDFKKN